MRQRLLPKLHPGVVLVLDNLNAHHDERVVRACRAHRVRVIYLPPYSPDLNPIEPGWALQQ
jgi:transposase